jgi:PAS domain-containing protein
VIAFLAVGLAISRLMTRLRRSFSDAQAMNKRLQFVIDTIPTLVSRARPDGSADFLNQRWQEYLGLTLEDVKGLLDPTHDSIFGRDRLELIIDTIPALVWCTLRGVRRPHDR